MSPQTRLVELGIELPPTPKPMGLYKPVLVIENLAYVSGHAPLRADGSRIVGRLGDDFTVEQGKAAARCSGLAILATLKNGLGSLDRVKRVVKIFGMVSSAAAFQQHAQVLNGCSELFVDIFGEEKGAGVRSAAGMSSLPGGIAVEIEAVFEVER